MTSSRNRRKPAPTRRPHHPQTLRFGWVDRWQRIFAAALLATVFIAPQVCWPGLYDLANLPKRAFLQCAAQVLLLLWLCRLYAAGGTGGRAVRLPGALYPLLALLGLSLAASLLAVNRYLALQAWMGYLSAATLFFLVQAGTQDRAMRVRLLWAILLSAGATALLGSSQHLLGYDLIPQPFPPAATFGNKNMAAQFILLALPLGGTLLLLSHRKVGVWGSAMLTALAAGFLFYTRTKAAWAGLVVSILVWSLLFLRARRQGGLEGLLDRRQKRAMAAACLLLAVMVNLGPGGFGGQLQSAATSTVESLTRPEDGQGTYSSLAIRLALWRNSFNLILDHPFIGVGLNNLQVHYPLYHRSAVIEKVTDSVDLQLVHLHNDYLQFLAELGLAVIPLLGWALVVLGRMVWHLTGRETPPQERLLAAGITAAIAGIMTDALLSFPFYRSIPAAYTLLLAGMLCSQLPDSRVPSRSLPGTCLLPLILAGTGGLLLFAGGHYRLLQSDYHFARQAYADSTGQWDMALQFGAKARRLNPLNHRILMLTGRAHIEKGSLETAIRDLTTARKGYPYNANTMINLAAAYLKSKKTAEAIDTYRAARRILPELPLIHKGLGNAAYLAGNRRLAMEAFGEMVRLTPDDAATHFKMGNIARELGRYEEAAAAFREAVRCVPGWAQAWKNLGAVHYQYLGDKKEALQYLEKAISLDPKLPEGDKIRALLDHERRKAQAGRSE